MNKIEILNNERKKIIASSKGNKITKTYIDEVFDNKKFNMYVIVKEIIEESHDTKSFILAPNKIKGTEKLEPFKAGEYISLKLNINDTYTTRAYTISSSPKDALKGFYRITVKRVENGLVSNYLLDNIEVGEELVISNPKGRFGISKVKDEENIIAIAGGSGITPFISLAYAIESGIYDNKLTVFYSVKKEEDILFKEELKKFNKTSKKVKFVITLTREEKEGYLYGHITKEMIEGYLSEFNTYLMCGPRGLYKTMNNILFELNAPKKSVYYENYYHEYDNKSVANYNLKIINKSKIEVINCNSNETILEALEKNNIKAPSLCRVGTCGFCRSILVEGKIKMVGATMPKGLANNDYIHPCVSYPESDLVIKFDF